MSQEGFDLSKLEIIFCVFLAKNNSVNALIPFIGVGFSRKEIIARTHTSDAFFCDKSQKPMKISLFNDQTEPIPSIEDFENEQGFVYVLRTDTYTKDGKEIVKIAFTAQDVNQRINQLYMLIPPKSASRSDANRPRVPTENGRLF